MKRNRKWIILLRAALALLALLLLVAGYHWYADWSGKRAWAEAQAQLKAAGISLDRKDYIPSPVPDDQNFAKAPITDDQRSSLADLRAASAARPYCQFQLEYPSYSDGESGGDLYRPAFIFFDWWDTIDLRSEESYALRNGQPQLCLDDLDLVWKVSSGLLALPPARKQVVRRLEKHLLVIGQGLAQHAWNDEQLAGLDDKLGKINLLAYAQYCIQANFVLYTLPLIESHKQLPWMLRNEMEERIPAADLTGFADFLMAWPEADLMLVSEGSLDGVLAEKAQWILHSPIDLGARRVHQPPRDGSWGVQAVVGFYAEGPRDWLVDVVATQTRLDKTRIGCRLERYRLAHGSYPDSLETLAKDYGALPHDIVSGGPYRYARDGTANYTLDSESWNWRPPHHFGTDWPWDQHGWVSGRGE